MRRRHLHRAHFVERDFHSTLGQRPRRLTPAEAAADDVYDATSSASADSASTVI